jgi:hypothetical protein
VSQIFKNSASGPVPPTAVTRFTFDDATVAIPVANNININSGAGVNVTANPNGSQNFIVNVINDGFPWSDQAVSFAAMPQNGYFCTATLTVTLPNAGIVTGSTVIIYVDTASSVVIKAGAGQQIEFSSTLSSVAGTATSTAQGNILQLVYRVSDTTWHTISSQGSFTLA